MQHKQEILNKLVFKKLFNKCNLLKFLLIVTSIVFIIFYAVLSYKDTSVFDFKYILSYWVDSFSLKNVPVFIKGFQVVRLTAVTLNAFIILVVFLNIKNHLILLFCKTWKNTISLFEFIPGKFVDLLKIDTVYWISIFPVLYILSYVTKVHAIPNNDYWGGFFLPVFNSRNIFDFIKALFYRNNEHLTFLPNVIFSLNFVISRGNNVFLYIINILINSLSLIFLTKSLSKEEIIPRKYLWVFYLLVSTMLFSPNMAHNWIRSMSGVMWFLANFFFFLTLIYSRKTLEFSEGLKKYFNLISTFTIMAFLTYSTSLAIPAVIIFYLLLNSHSWKKNKEIILKYFVLSILLYLFWFLFWYRKPAYHPNLTFSFFDNVNFIKIFIGSGFSDNIQIAKYYGDAGLILLAMTSVITLFIYLKRRDSNIFPILTFFYSFEIYTIINIFLSVASRSDNREIEYVMNINRYVNISNLLWLGIVLYIFTLIIFLFRNVNNYLRPLLINTFLGLFFLFIFIRTYSFGFISMGALVQSFDEQEVPFKLSTGMNIYDSEAFRTFIGAVHVSYHDEYVSSYDDGGYYPTFMAITKTPLYKLHYPFNLKIPKYSYKKKVKNFEIFKKSENIDTVLGSIDNVRRLVRNTADIEDIPVEKDRPKDYKITGWVCVIDEKIENMLIIDESSRIRGAGIVFEERVDVVATYGDECLVSGFVAYIREAVPGARYPLFLIGRDGDNYYFQDISIPSE